MYSTPTAQAAGWTIPDWCASTSISRASFYLLAQRPRTVKLGRRTVVIESPDAYLQRIADTQLEAA
ncbi:MAG: hypothetical protein ACK5RJ_13955 [Burkholderiales bacterium]|jgi:hypothetical protein|nr:hypothetical protein [Rhodocyclaceae bacterium]MCA3018594.1 hypothetical protein [Rhodocyclaceae bacterium]MCA3022007.1 hypothetical protein [Rhodocyclaceae bacterium]MCA3024908.1 hypothetical protein [Rhodocyclaceae bacterium]MCA3032217.1 hypothetical protein [Rhodocyclaceae bacterium]